MLASLRTILTDVPMALMVFKLISVEGYQVLAEIGKRYGKELAPHFSHDTTLLQLDSSSNAVGLHFDHRRSMERIVAAIRLGFTLVMYHTLEGLSDNMP